MSVLFTTPDATEMRLATLRRFLFPGGEEAARAVRGVDIEESGEIRMSPGARWIPFTAQTSIDATRSSFRWDARLSTNRIAPLGVTDAYEEGHGRIVIKAAALVPVKKFTGPEFDRGEQQRYLASIVLCPPILLNHPSLVWSVVSPLTLRVQDRQDTSGAIVHIEMDDEGRPLVCRAERPMLVGRRTVLTPWSGVCCEFREWEGMRVASRLEVSWQLPDGVFHYYRSEATRLTAVR